MQVWKVYSKPSEESLRSKTKRRKSGVRVKPKTIHKQLPERSLAMKKVFNVKGITYVFTSAEFCVMGRNNGLDAVTKVKGYVCGNFGCYKDSVFRVFRVVDLKSGRAFSNLYAYPTMQKTIEMVFGNDKLMANYSNMVKTNKYENYVSRFNAMVEEGN